MTDLRWAPFLSMLDKEMTRFRRVIGQTIWLPLLNSALYFLVFGVSLGDEIAVVQGGSYLAFLVPGLVMMGALNNAFQNSSSSIATSKFHGDLEDLRRAPITSLQMTCAFVLAAIARAFIVAAVTMLVGEVFSFFAEGHWIIPAHPLALIFFLFVGSASFGCLGMVVAFHAKSMDGLGVVGGFILMPLLYLGGVFFPLSSLHPFWQAVSHANPILYFINGVRYGVLGHADMAIGMCTALSLVGMLIFGLLAYDATKRGSYSRW